MLTGKSNRLRMIILCQVTYVSTILLGGGLMHSNIYVITNNVNGKKYVGQTTDVDKRWYAHQYCSKNRTDHNIYLYNAINKYGIEEFTFKIIESNVSLSEVNEREEYWIKNLNTHSPNGYNLTIGGEGTKGYKMSDETKEKISKAAKYRFSRMSKSERLSITRHLPKNGGNLNLMNEGFRRWLTTSSPEVIQKRINDALQTKREMNYDYYNFSFGKMTKEEKDKMYNKISKSNPRSQTVLMILDEFILKEFHSIGEAARYLIDNFNASKSVKNSIRMKLDTDKTLFGYTWRRK